jgi:hypothetical protein
VLPILRQTIGHDLGFWEPRRLIDHLRESLGPDADDEIDTIVSMFFTHAETHLQAAREAVARAGRREAGAPRRRRR